MSYNTSMDTITVNDIEYDVDRNDRGNHTVLTIMLDGEDVFKGLEGSIGYDEFAQEHHNPREWSNVGRMAVSYGRYNLGDENISEIDFEIECDDCEGEGWSEHWAVGIQDTATLLAVGSQEACAEYLESLADKEDGRYYFEPLACNKCKGDGLIFVNPIDYYKKEHNARVVLPLIVYEHSGITMSVGHVGDYPFDAAGWDTSFVGFIYDTPEGVKQCLGENVSDEAIENALRSEVSVYASYLEGDVTEFMVEDDETNFHESCGGFVGDAKECENQCFSALESAIMARLAEQKERAEMAARDIITKE
jgi:hypothetical protein